MLTPDYLNSSGCSSLKLSAASAGRTTSLFPVNAAPQRPPPPPAGAPLSAPLPPPARPPINAPRPAPPPARTAVRLPLPVSVRVTEELEIDCSDPFTVIEVNRNCNTAPPLNRPRGFASSTVPAAAAPVGITVLPSTASGLASVAVKLWPGALILEPTACPRRTVSTVPAGTINGFGGSGFAIDFIFDIFDMVAPQLLFDVPGPALLLGAELAVLSVGAAGAGALLLLFEFETLESAGLLLQPSTKKDR